MVWRCSYGVENCPICMRPVETAAERQAREERARAILAKVEEALKLKRLKIALNRLTGKISIEGLSAAERMGADDGSLLAMLKTKGSAMLRAEIARAEVQAGRRVQTN